MANKHLVLLGDTVFDQTLRGKPRHSWRGSSEQPAGL